LLWLTFPRDRVELDASNMTGPVDQFPAKGVPVMSRYCVLNVGQCGFDQSRISRFLHQSFGAEARSVDTFAEALAALRTDSFDLVLVNRVSDLDGSSGLDLIRSIKAETKLAGVPVMLVSDYPEAQADAQALGALPGFGKSALSSDRAEKCVRAVLSSSR
jgi:two-component system chemotaxis response regulator CheY